MFWCFGAVIPFTLTDPPCTQPSIFDLLPGPSSFFGRAPPAPAPVAPPATEEEEGEILRKRGWVPPRRSKSKSLRERLRGSEGSSTNPFLGRKRSKRGENPFDDEAHVVPQEEDEFSDVERPAEGEGEGMQLGSRRAVSSYMHWRINANFVHMIEG